MAAAPDQSDFRLHADGDSPFASRPITAEHLAKWSAAYHADGRTIRRWIDDGDTAGDPCPINDPVRLVEWWPRLRKWRIPDALLIAAKAAALRTDLDRLHGPSAAPPPPASPTPSVGPEFAPINLADFRLAEGEAVAQQRRIVAALYSQLEAAYLSGRGNADLIQSKYNKAVEALRRLDKDDREDQKQRGLVIPRVSVQRDVEFACEMIRQMGESEARRVIELCPSLGELQRAEVAAAITRTSEARAAVFRSLRTLKAPADALVQFAAA